MTGLPDKETLNRLLRYVPETGKLYWRERPVSMFKPGRYSAASTAASWNTQFAGKEAFTAKNKAGYPTGILLRKTYLAHRIIWKMVTGDEPPQIDHIDGRRANNRFTNLRSADATANARNAKIRRDNTSGVTGVRWNKLSRKWVARLHVNGAERYLGCFDTKEQAEQARLTASREHGYHPNHGRRK